MNADCPFKRRVTRATVDSKYESTVAFCWRAVAALTGAVGAPLVGALASAAPMEEGAHKGCPYQLLIDPSGRWNKGMGCLASVISAASFGAWYKEGHAQAGTAVRPHLAVVEVVRFRQPFRRP